MPWHIDVDREAQRCTVHLVGVVTMDDLKAGLQARAAAGAWPLPTLIDLTGATELTVHWPDMSHLAAVLSAMLHAMPARGRTALLAGNPAVFGVARMYEEAVAADLQLVLRVFDERDAAVAWLSEAVG